MPIKPFAIQKRMMELGRVRLGEKGGKGEPRKLEKFRFTSASRALLDALAVKYGGTVKPWEAADDGYFELYTDANQINIVLPPVFSDADGEPTYPFSQWFEQWSGGGCTRRCDGETEMLTGKPCMCDAGERACKPTTRVSFMMPDIPGLGVWRVESHGYNVAAEMPGTINVLANAAAEGKFIPAVLRLEPRTSKKDGLTRKFVVPVIDLPNITVAEIVSGDLPLAINAPLPPPERPALPAAEELPGDASFAHDESTAAWGEAPLPEPVFKKPTQADRKRFDKVVADLGEAQPDAPGRFADWAEVAEAAARKEFDGKSVDELDKPSLEKLAAMMGAYLETLRTPA